MAKFKYINSNLRIGKEPATHRSEKSVTWADNSLQVWSQGNWEEFKKHLSDICKGTSEGARLIERTLNILNTYTRKGNTQMSAADKDALGISDLMAAQLVESLQSMNLGESSAQSLLDYLVTGQGISTAQNAGFSFESRFSEFIYRVAGKVDFDYKKTSRRVKLKKPTIDKRGKEVTYRTEVDIFDERKNLRSGGQAVNVGRRLTNQVAIDTADIYEAIINEAVDKIDKEIASQQNPEILKLGYMVPDKADISIPANLQIYADFGPLLTAFIEAVRGKRFSLKNTFKTEIKLGETKDPTRLMGFADSFLRGVGYNFAGLATFVFASRRASQDKNDQKVLTYTNWGRVFYELLGAGQFDKADNELLVDYLVVNTYDKEKTNGVVKVFAVQDLVAEAPGVDPTSLYFSIDNKKGEPYGGPVKLDLTKVSNFLFTHS